jgi:CBS domain containing-hemolysin-like protein
LKGEKSIKSILQEVVFTTEYTRISTLLKQLQKEKVHMAVVSDEYGGVVGIVTLEDVLEELVGDIWDESDEIDQTFTKLGGNRYRVDTHMTLGETLSRLNCPPPEARLEKTPLIAWIFEMFRHIPEMGESFRYRNLEVTVDQIDGHRVSFVEIYIDNDFLPDEDPAAVADGTLERDGDASFDESTEEVTAV